MVASKKIEEKSLIGIWEEHDIPGVSYTDYPVAIFAVS
jgi:hypothetical protein